MNRTPFAETEALLAVMEEDYEKAERIIDTFHAGELWVFRNNLIELKSLIDKALRHMQVFKD